MYELNKRLFNRDPKILQLAQIDTFPKYFIIVLYTIISTVVRTLQQEIITPWLIQNVQNDKPKDEFVVRYAQEISFGECIYRWFDWFMYMHILLAQIDMMIIELVGNIIAVIYTTHLYMKPKPEENEELIEA